MKQLGFSESNAILKKYSLRLSEFRVIDSEKELMQVEKRYRPYVLKAYTPDIVHKEKSGLVFHNINTPHELIADYKILKSRIKGQKNAKILLQKKMEGAEFIIGTKKDAIFGYAVLFGVGGVFTEQLNKAILRIHPFSNKVAIEMVEKIAGNIINEQKIKKKIAELLVKVGKISEKEKIEEMDLNPVIVSKKWVHLVDVRIMK